MAGTTGQGTTVAFTTLGAVACLRSLTLPEWSMESIDASCLSDTGFMKKIAGDLVDAGEVSMTVVFELTDNLEQFIPDGVQDTITITFPTAGATSGILTGTGYITSVTAPDMQINQLLEQTITFTFDGETGPAYTPGT